MTQAGPADTAIAGFYRVRFDHVDRCGKLSLRRAGRMHHLGVGITHAGKAVTILITDHQVTVVDRSTGEILATHTISPTRTYWRNEQREPGHWPGSRPL
ncbi:hypothetical protein [Jiangella rhizosphaerae]|uniref:Transposase n=1 Tax=Jiangella rhizosphaerae TaxID=2293569 RepID=A0A418KM52_9ACTN|nr:hypothetical protein [Jiangella rhizosphaerae]RIQ19462.1 hypothetical protein DY240_19870 [Jiangella rhizosphaerae]